MQRGCSNQAVSTSPVMRTSGQTLFRGREAWQEKGRPTVTWCHPPASFLGLPEGGDAGRPRHLARRGLRILSELPGVCLTPSGECLFSNVKKSARILTDGASLLALQL